jgi:hypothetical protein
MVSSANNQPNFSLDDVVGCDETGGHSIDLSGDRIHEPSARGKLSYVGNGDELFW